jgi:hypothetical protein
LEAALDEIAAQPGVRMFCTMLSSVVVHVGLLCLLFLAFWGAAGIIQESEAPAAVPSAVQLAADTNGSGYKFPGKVAENHEDGRRDESRPAAAGLIGNSPETELAAALPTTAGLKAGAAEAGPGRATAPGWATLRGPGGPIFGDGAAPGAGTIVYVVDRSGSMDVVGDFLKMELAKAVNRLTASQRFNVVWFGDGEPYSLALQPVAATEDNKTRLFRLSDGVRFSGSTDPWAAVFKAIQQRPDLVYVLTDGNFEPGFVEAVTKANTARVRINVVGFVLGQGEGHTNLVRLAERNNGRFRAVTAAMLTGDGR